MAEAVFVHDPGYLQVTAGGNYAPGEVVPLAKRIAIYNGLQAAVSGQPCTLRTTGVWTLACKTSDTWSADALLYWDNSNNELTTTSSANTLAGKAVAAKGSGPATCDIDINAGGLVS